MGIDTSGASEFVNREITPTPAGQHVIEQATHSGPAPVHIGDRRIVPGVVHANIASAASSLPISLLAMIVFTLAGLVVMAGRKITSGIARSQQS